MTGHAVAFSVSRTGSVVAVACASTGAIGLDIEAIGRWHFPIQAQTNEAEVRDRLVEWTRKESILKALGLGLALDPRTVHLSRPGDPPALIGLPAEYGSPAEFFLTDVGLRSDIVGHLAVIGEETEVVAHDAAPMLLDL
jgi:hypothetical protein